MTLGLSPLKTGFSALDMVLDGLRSPELVIVSSRPGMFKTELCLQIASQIAYQGQIAAYLSLHQDPQEITQQILAVAARVPLYRIKSGDISPTERQNLTEKMESLPDLPLWIDSLWDAAQEGTNLSSLRRQLKDLQQENLPLGLVVVDDLQRLKSNEGDLPGTEGRILSALRDLAQELGCAILGITQLPQVVEERSKARPTLFDLKQSYEDIDQIADVIIFLHRPAPTSGRTLHEPVELIVSRKDHTKAATLTLKLDHELHCFWEQQLDLDPNLAFVS